MNLCHEDERLLKVDSVNDFKVCVHQTVGELKGLHCLHRNNFFLGWWEGGVEGGGRVLVTSSSLANALTF